MMKGEDCKVPIREENRTFLNKQKSPHFSGSKKVGIIAAFLLLIAMSLMIVFTFQSINGISELRQEVDYLKAALQVLQKKISEDNRDSPKSTTTLPNVVKDDYNEDDENYSEYDYDHGDYSSYEYYENDNEYDDIPNNTEPLTGEKYTKDAKTATAPPRSRRSIIGYSEDETPVNSEGYDGRRRNVTHRKNYQYSTSLPPSSYSHPFYPDGKTQLVRTTPAPRQIHTARIRVYHDQKNSGRSADSHNTENSDVEFAVVNDDHVKRVHPRHRQKRLEFEEGHARTGRMRPLPTAHFSGDTSKYVLGQHDNFNGNGHLRHPQRTFVDWAESSWFHALGMDRHFSLSDGILTIKESGLYFIYAQIYYLDEHDINGFRVYRNENETLLQCTTMTHSADRVMKGNTCFTAAAEYLNENDRISLGDLSESRYSLFEPGKSFFGVIKLGDVKIK